MNADSGIFKLVYEYYEARILYGFYRSGDNLPSIAKICDIFRLAPATVRMALAQLEKNGYIQVDARKAARVIYEGTSGTYRENAARYFVPRKEGIIDLTSSGKLLFEPLWEAGLRCWEENDWDVLRRDMIEPQPDAVAMPVQLYLLAIGALDNKLMVNFYWEMVRYIRFPYLACEKESRQSRLKLKDTSKDEVIKVLKESFDASYTRAITDLFAFIDDSRSRYHMEKVEPVPFCWGIYRQRPQIRYTLVSDIIREISRGRYPQGSYLPSLPQMAQLYGVGQNTIRRTLSILEGLGITKSFQGKGTLIYLKPLQIDFSMKEIKEGMRLYRESLQLLSITIRNVCIYTLKAVPKETRVHLVEAIRKLRCEGKSYLCFEACLAFIEEKCPLQMVRECYSKIRGLMAWGYPFILLWLQDQSLDSQYNEVAAQLENHLREERLEEFADDFKQLIEQEELRIKAEFGEFFK